MEFSQQSAHGHWSFKDYFCKSRGFFWPNLLQPLEVDSPELSLLQTCRNCSKYALNPSSLMSQELGSSVPHSKPHYLHCSLSQGCSSCSVLNWRLPLHSSPSITTWSHCFSTGICVVLSCQGPLVNDLWREKVSKWMLLVHRDRIFRKTAAFTKSTVRFLAISSRLIKGNQALVLASSKQSPVLQGKYELCKNVLIFFLLLTSGAQTQLRKSGWNLHAFLHLFQSKCWTWYG